MVINKIFISYNHKDKTQAIRVGDKLKSAGFEVIRDEEAMQSGENISAFILRCIKSSGVTLSVVSRNSLLSAWVAMETIYSQMEVETGKRVFIPAFIDASFFQRNFTDIALDEIDKEIAEISALLEERLAKGRGIQDLQGELKRYRDLQHGLDGIVAKLKDSLCIDISETNFDKGMDKIISDLKSNSQNLEDNPKQSLKEKAQSVRTNLQNKIANTLDEFTKQRLSALEKRLGRLQDLLSKYEEAHDFEDDPKRQMRYEKEIDSTHKSIQKVLTEIEALS